MRWYNTGKEVWIMHKRILALVLVLSLSIGLTSTVYAAEEFADEAEAGAGQRGESG